MTFADFEKSLKRFYRIVENRTTYFSKELALTFLEKFVELNPVDTGRSSANWIISIGGPNFFFDYKKFSSKNVVNEGRVVLESFSIGEDIYIQNNIFYIVILEFVEIYRGSSQAPNGIVRVSLTEFPLVAKMLVSEAKAQF